MQKTEHLRLSSHQVNGRIHGCMHSSNPKVMRDRDRKIPWVYWLLLELHTQQATPSHGIRQSDRAEHTLPPWPLYMYAHMCSHTDAFIYRTHTQAYTPIF